MRRQHDVLVLQDRIRSRQQSDDVGRFESSDATATVARSDAGSSNVGSGFPASARARMSLKVWPVPAKNFSARAGLIVTASFCPAVSSSAGSASVSEGWKRERI